MKNTTEKSPQFINAKPIWIKGKEKTINITMGLYVYINSNTDAVLKIATSGFYRVFINGDFYYYGPSRCAHGFFRVDEIPLPKSDDLHIAVEVVNYYINTYDYICQSGFVMAEISDESGVLACTGDTSFSCLELFERMRKVQRFSRQRAFVECYNIHRDYSSWRIGKKDNCALICDIEITESKALLKRIIPLNKFNEIYFNMVSAFGKFDCENIPNSYYKHSSLLAAGKPKEGFVGGFCEEELECHLSDEVQEFCITELNKQSVKIEENIEIKKGDFYILSLPIEKTGFLFADIKCKITGDIYFLFDEILNENGDVSPFRLECTNIIKLSCEEGGFSFVSFNPIGLKHLKIMVPKGEFTVKKIGIKEYICPVPVNVFYQGKDKKLSEIFNAAKETFLQNSADIFTDCPTRERAGWLCDSYFIAKAESFFTGKNIIEKNFLENYLLPKAFDNIPKKMVPMCYPADQPAGRFIPNWAMWLTIELYDYLVNRNGEKAFVMRFKERIYNLIDWFKEFENGDGLLEKLPGWIFVEWSKANDLVNDINFPTNMLYCYMLKCVSEMFGDKQISIKSESLKNTIIKYSFDGEFFVDNEVYENGRLVSSKEHTETCQYYAFFCKIATPKSFPQLWERLLNDFGPNRAKNNLYPKIYPSNAFIGNYLRLFILKTYGYNAKALEEIKDYFYYMAEKTGTLWENKGDYASCNHGFASCVAEFIYEKGNI